MLHVIRRRDTVVVLPILTETSMDTNILSVLSHIMVSNFNKLLCVCPVTTTYVRINDLRIKLRYHVCVEYQRLLPAPPPLRTSLADRFFLPLEPRLRSSSPQAISSQQSSSSLWLPALVRCGAWGGGVCNVEAKLRVPHTPV